MNRRVRRWLVSAALGLALSPLWSEPSLAGDPQIELEFERYVLDNGLEVILHPDPSAPEISVNLWYHVGSGDEEPGKSGFAHLFEHMMFQGAKHIGEDVHFDTLKSIGASGVNGTTNTDRTNYFETVPRHEIETALWLESDRMGYLLDMVTEESFRNQVDVVRNERRQRYDNVPYGHARFMIAEELYPEGHSYRYLTIGRHDDLENATLDDVHAFFLKWYVPSNATLTLAGDFEVDDMKGLVDKWFGSFPKLPKPERSVVETPALAKTVRRVEEDAFAKLEQVQWVWHGPKNLGEDSFDLDVGMRVLGANGWGRLYKRLVLGEQLCTYATAYSFGQQHTGQIALVAQLKPGVDRTRVEAIFQEELDKLAAEPISDAELERVVLNTESSFIWGLESLGSRANRLQWFNHFTGDPGYVDEYLKRLRAVTPASVKTAMGKWTSKPRVELVLTPKKGGEGEGGAKPKAAKPAKKGGDQ